MTRPKNRLTYNSGEPEVTPNLPDPNTMTIEELRAEVQGGRIAYAALIEKVGGLEGAVNHARDNLRGAHETIRTLVANGGHL